MELVGRDTTTFPSQALWQLIGIGGQQLKSILDFLFKNRHHINTISHIKRYAHQHYGDLLPRNKQLLLASLLDVEFWDTMEKDFVGLASDLIPLLQKVQKHHKKVLVSFISIIQSITEHQTHCLQKAKLSDKWYMDSQGYAAYILLELLKEGTTLNNFLQQQNMIYNQIHQQIEFYHHRVDEWRREKDIQEEEQHSEVELDSTGTIMVEVNLQTVFNRIKDTLDDLIRQVQLVDVTESNFSLNVYGKVVLAISTTTLILNFCTFVYSLTMFDHYDKLSEDQDMWKGSGLCLVYLWINCYLANHCYDRRINVLIGMNCKYLQEICYYKFKYLIILMALTSLYLLTFSIYLLVLHQKWIGFALNIFLVLCWLGDFCYVCDHMGIFKGCMSKLSFLHCMVLLVPVTDVLQSCFLIPFPISFPTPEGLYLIFTLAASICVLKQKGIGYPVNEMAAASLSAVAVAIIQICLLAITPNWTNTQNVFKAGSIVLNLFLLCFFMGHRHAPLSLKLTWEGFKELFSSVFTCSEDDNPPVLYALLATNTFSRPIRVAVWLLSICFVILLSFAPNCHIIFDSNPKFSKYLFEAAILAGYIIWSINYISEVNLQLKHTSNLNKTRLPLSGCTKFEHSVPFISEEIGNFAQMGRLDKLNVSRLQKRQRKLNKLYCIDLDDLNEKRQSLYAELTSGIAYQITVRSE